MDVLGQRLPPGNLAAFYFVSRLRETRMKLVILDFAGTLSLETVLFGRDGNLETELEKSGLSRLGVSGAGLFWNELVLPGWEEGSRTARGYKAVLAEKLRVFSRSRGISAPEDAVYAAAAGFVEAYFRASPISAAWRQPLRDLAAAPDVFTLIATDHYAEAAAHIQSLLASWGLNARPARAACFSTEDRRSFLIACSADLGAHKAEPAFWISVREVLERIFFKPLPEAFTSIKIVDDFGFNENASDDYGGGAKALARRDSTEAAIHAACGLIPGVFPFFLENPNQEDGAARQRSFEDLVRKAELFIGACSIELFRNLSF
jgi:hypothetical protein